jgi:peptidoglycan biosynthesis protein MviN/MurJ (putative lipid II flippase)
MSSDSNNNLKTQSAGLFRVGILVAIGGFLVTSTTAWCYGVSAEAVAFFAAWSVCASFQKLLQGGQLAELSLPRYLKDKKEFGAGHALKHYSLLANWATIAAIILSGTLAIVVPYFSKILLPGFEESQSTKVIELFRGLMPVIPVIVYSGFMQSLGNAEKHYGKFEVWLFFGQLVAAVSVIVLHNHVGVWALVWSAWLTQLVAIIGRLFYLHKFGCRPTLSLWIKGYSPKQLLSELGLTSTYVIATQFYILSLNAALTFLSPVLFAVFKYAELLFERTSSLVLRPVSTVFFTDASHEFTREKSGLPKLITNTLTHFADYWILYFCIVGACAVPLISLAWGNKKFDWESVLLTSQIFGLLAGAALFRAIGLVFRKNTIAAGSARRQYMGSIVVQLLMVLITVPVVKTFGFWGGAAVLCINIILFSISDILAAMTTNIKPLVLIPYKYFIKTFILSIAIIITARVLSDVVYAQTLTQFGNQRIADVIVLIASGLFVIVTLETVGRAIGLGGVRILFSKKTN